MHTPRVSVVVPTFDNAPFVEQAIASILAQTFTDFELLISDHSSSDGTWELLEQFTSDPRVRLSRVAAGGGAPANWRAVTARARGELLKLVCGDDLLHPDVLARQVAALDEHPRAVLVSCRRDVIDARGAVLLSGRGLPGLTGVVPGEVAIKRSVIAGTNIFGEPACVLMRRRVLAAAGGWDDRTPYLIDQATFAAVLRHGDLIALPDTLAAFRVDGGQWSVALSREQASHARAFHASVVREHPDLLRRRDRWTGDARAMLAAAGRRALYAWLGSRYGRRWSDRRPVGWTGAGPVAAPDEPERPDRPARLGTIDE